MNDKALFRAWVVKFKASSLTATLVVGLLFFAIPEYLVVILKSHSDHVLTSSLAIKYALICIACGCAFALMIWLTLVLPMRGDLLRSKKKEE